ncbi:signal peptidase I [Altericroceibacterium spongiae]|uniref:Signal peptidase I n=1 Tax=Altericroceibacterium spongiae TaxID=2320269 RepID=A0A420EET2_9SPHN|nr:signal peptidase I [Altericroceibacterium spongiae]RKF19197.1 signal peptidase I [Altericroceibacterium spongiae]
MNDTATGEAGTTAPSSEKAEGKKEDSFLLFLLKLVLFVLIFRSFIFSPFSIPSESMLPRLETGDYLLAAKWPYGFSKYSLPFSAPLIPGRILAGQPERGDVVIFKAPPLDQQDYIKRVIGLPGDQIQVIGGVVNINGQPVKRERTEDFVIPVSVNTSCKEARFAERQKDGALVCRYPQFRETLPNGVSFNTLDFGMYPQDNTDPIIVPEGKMFLMGDNRDNSMDSRFPAVPGGGIGLVPQANLIGRATIVMWSTDGSAEWLKPWTWFTAARWSRIGHGF